MPRVLIIEEQEKIRRLLVSMFKQEGFETCHGIVWEKAKELPKKNIYDLIIIDLYVKPIDGYEIMKSIKFFHPAAEVIAIIPQNGYDTGQMISCGIYDYVLKPFRQKDILDKGKKALEKKQLIDKVRSLEQIMDMDT
ncbi:MAG: response regulator [Candidatus Jettenia caeni]|nr:response regulator [Candidatus Jettenia caeni]WKZ19022.1 MAG: response regulator [Candidatus Jettenia sp. CY-1]